MRSIHQLNSMRIPVSRSNFKFQQICRSYRHPVQRCWASKLETVVIVSVSTRLGLSAAGMQAARRSVLCSHQRQRWLACNSTGLSSASNTSNSTAQCTSVAVWQRDVRYPSCHPRTTTVLCIYAFSAQWWKQGLRYKANNNDLSFKAKDLKIVLKDSLTPRTPITVSALTLSVGRQEGHQACKNWVVGCWHGYLSGARCRLAYGPADATATHCLLLQ